MGFFLGIDGGGSKTECVLADEAGAVLARASGPGANLRRVTSAELRATLSSCFEQLQQATGLSAIKPEAVCAGFAGAGHPQARVPARDALTSLLHPRYLYVVGDMEVALEAAVGAGAGVVLVAGTGSIAYGRNERGQQARAGGEGPEEGDQGSGFDIGRQALGAVQRARDARGPRTQLTASVLAALRLSKIEELSVRPSLSPAQLAGLVPAVVEAARAGDGPAGEILEQAAAALAGLAVTVLRELGLVGTQVLVATTGGVFSESGEVFAGVQKRIQAAAPRARVEPLRVAPAEGAVRLAQRLWLQERAAV